MARTKNIMSADIIVKKELQKDGTYFLTVLDRNKREYDRRGSKKGNNQKDAEQIVRYLGTTLFRNNKILYYRLENEKETEYTISIAFQ